MEDRISICGLDCFECDIYQASTDKALAEKIAGYLQQNQAGIDAKDIHCGGCRGPLTEHWSPTCEILQCSREKGYHFCCQCGDFICSKYNNRLEIP
ncbi:MAG: DUF3795 domain-containing protein [Halanaerobium sp.]|nr:DUF3795 domain-containing protein [Halanaerobium sp.]